MAPELVGHLLPMVFLSTQGDHADEHVSAGELIWCCGFIGRQEQQVQKRLAAGCKSGWRGQEMACVIWTGAEELTGEQEGNGPSLQACWATLTIRWAHGRDTSKEQESRKSLRHCLKEEGWWVKVLKAIK